MISPIELGREFFEMLVQIDEAIVERAAAKVCGECGVSHRSSTSAKGVDRDSNTWLAKPALTLLPQLSWPS